MATSKNKFKTILAFSLPILVLIVLASYTFRNMLKMIVWGQGFEYLLKYAQDSFWNNLPRSLANYEISAVLLGTLGYKVFGLNDSLYYWTWLAISLVVSILIFFLTYILTGKRWVAFSAALMNSVSYASQMGLIGWTDTSFIGRVPNLILLIPSFTFLHLFLKQSKFKFYLISIILFFLGIGLGQFGLLLGFSYIIYPLFWHIFKSRKEEKSSYLIKRILVSASFAIISIFFVNIHSYGINAQGPSSGFTYFLLRPQTYHYLEEIPLQLAHWSNYPNLAKGIYLKTYDGLNASTFGYKGTIREHFTDITANKEAAYRIAIFYLLAILLIYFRLPEQRPLLLTIIFGTGIMLIENIYIGHYKPEEQVGANRYLLYPTIWLSVFWALFLWVAFWKRGNRLLMVLGIAILGGYYLINTVLIQTNLNEMLYIENSTYRKAINLFTYVKNIRPTLKPDTLIITSSDELDCSADIFLNEQLGKGEVVFWPLNANKTCLQPGGLEKIASSSAQVIRLNYDQNCECVIEEKIK